MGLRHGDGTIHMNPPIHTALQADDSVLILAEDDSTIDYQMLPVARPRSFTLAGGRKSKNIEQNLIIGWSPNVEVILREYAEYVEAGSFIDIMLRAPDDGVKTKIDELNRELRDLEITLIEENPLSTDGLMSVQPFKFDNIIILSQGGTDGDFERTDSETIVILLMLRSIMRNRPNQDKQTKLITEILDSENQSLVAHAGVHDFIISNRFISMLNQYSTV